MALLLLPIPALALVGSPAQPARADSTVTNITWPSVPTPYSVNYALDNGGVAVLNDDCINQYHYGASTDAIVTLNQDYTVTGTVTKTNGSWSVVPCDDSQSFGDSTTGNDGTVYFVQGDGSYRLAAMREGTILWYNDFASECLTSVAFYSLHMGYDGNVYGEDECNDHGVVTWGLFGVNAGTGAVRFITPLPHTVYAPSYGDVMPYQDGIAVLNNGVNVYYYSYSGVLDSSNTFSPSAPSGAQPAVAAVTADGRVYLVAWVYDSHSPTNMDTYIYYKDPGTSTIYQLTLPSGRYYNNGIYTTPTDGVVVQYINSSGAGYFGYYDSDGTEAYEQALTRTVNGVSVDNDGNVIVVSTQGVTIGTTGKQEVYVDQYSPTDVATRLFDSNAEFGTSGVDAFTTSNWLPDSIGNGVIYLTLCHQTNPTGAWPTTCSSYNGNPQLLAISTSSDYSYPRSAAIAAVASQDKLNYVALGDSYSSGEANPPFIEPTDNDGGDGCDRSTANAYPELLANDASLNLDLQAFVACSGAGSDDVYTGYDGEPSQLNSLDASTQVVTITIGGDNVDFKDFAENCVTSDCNADSSAYQTTMTDISDYLEDDLTLLFSRIQTAAPNATVYVAGYPMLMPSTPNSGCPSWVDNDEPAAITTVITALDNTISTAVSEAGSNFVYLDPTGADSPFAGHDLCSGSESYFTGLSTPTQFSFHPNANGQAAYADLFASAMS